MGSSSAGCSCSLPESPGLYSARLSLYVRVLDVEGMKDIQKDVGSWRQPEKGLA